MPGDLSVGVRKLLDRGPGTENYHAWMKLSNVTMMDMSMRIHFRVWDPMASSLPPLFYACRLGLVGETTRCIRAGSDINQYLSGWGTPLQMSQLQDNHKVTEILLQCGADAKTRDELGRTAFGRAAAFGHEMSRCLVFNHGIDANDELEDALSHRDIETVRFLLEHGADSNFALQGAVCCGDFDMVRLIVEKSTDLNTDNYACALFAAARVGQPVIFNLLLERGASVSATGGDSPDILLAALHGGSLGIVSRLVESGVNVNALGSLEIHPARSRPQILYTTPLQYAAHNGDYDIIKYLLNNGAEVNRLGFSLGTELQAAIRFHVNSAFQRLRPMEEILHLLLEHGADVNQQVHTRSFETPSSQRSRTKGNALQQAIAEGLDSIAQLLVKKGADINAQHSHCGTALMCASRYPRIRVLRALINMKADVNAQVAGLGSALSEAAKWGQRKNVGFLIRNGADVHAEVQGIGTTLLTALLHGQFKTAAVLIEAGADLSAAVQDMSTAFSTASEKEGREIIKLCFESYHPYPKAADDGSVQDKREQRGTSGRGKTFRSCI